MPGKQPISTMGSGNRLPEQLESLYERLTREIGTLLFRRDDELLLAAERLGLRHVKLVRRTGRAGEPDYELRSPTLGSLLIWTQRSRSWQPTSVVRMRWTPPAIPGEADRTWETR